MKFYCILFALAIACPAYATLTAIGTTTNGPLGANSGDTFGALYNDGYLFGFEFTVPFTAELYSVTLPLENQNDNVTVSLTLYAGTTLPDTAVALAIANVTLTSNAAQDYTFNYYPRPTELYAGQNYFLMGSIPTTPQGEAVYWYGNNTNTPVTVVEYNTGWEKFNYTNSPAGPAWQAELETPEPASLGLIGAGLAAIAVLKRRRKI